MKKRLFKDIPNDGWCYKTQSQNGGLHKKIKLDSEQCYCLENLRLERTYQEQPVFEIRKISRIALFKERSTDANS